MLDNKDYSKWTLEELLIEEKKVKKMKPLLPYNIIAKGDE